MELTDDDTMDDLVDAAWQSEDDREDGTNSTNFSEEISEYDNKKDERWQWPTPQAFGRRYLKDGWKAIKEMNIKAAKKSTQCQQKRKLTKYILTGIKVMKNASHDFEMDEWKVKYN